MPWWRIEAECREADYFAAEAVALGASGAEELSPHSFVCYFEGDESGCEGLISNLKGRGVRITGCSPMNDVNWVQHCEEIWTPVTVGRVTLYPVVGRAVARVGAGDGCVINIVPGSGFGTGHHPSTRQILTLMQGQLGRSPANCSVLDLGTGSGVLAIAAHRLLGAKVLALDIDELAIENARENILLNQCSNAVTLRCGELRDADGVFDLICANIYAEVLSSLEPRFQTSLKAGGLLLVAGVLQERRDALKGVYLAGWEVLGELDEGEWWAGALRLR